MRRLTLLIALFVVGAACGSTEAAIGPLTLEPPQGWLVTDRTANSIKVTNGTIGDDTGTEAGTATAVFDVYIRSEQTADEFRKVLRENNVRPKIERIEVDGKDATVVSYESGAFGPSTEVVFVPERDVRIVYRAAFSDAESAFVKHRPEFRRALASIRFSDRQEVPA